LAEPRPGRPDRDRGGGRRGAAGAAPADGRAERGDLRRVRADPRGHPPGPRDVPRGHPPRVRPLAAEASGVLRTDHRRRGGDPRRPRGECSMSGTSPSTGPDAGRHPIITEEDLASLDTSEGHGEEARPEEPVNAACATVGGWIAIVATVRTGAPVTVAVVMRYVPPSSLPPRAAGRPPIIPAEGLASLATSEGHGEEARPEGPVNAACATVGGWIAIVATVLIVALVTVAVVMRYVLNSSLPIAAEGPTYLFPWLIAGGAIVAQGSRGHIAVDVLVGRLRGRALERAQIAIWAFSTLLLAYLTYLAVYLIPPMAAQSTPIMGWPQLGSFSAFIVMVAVMAVQAGARTVHCIR